MTSDALMPAGACNCGAVTFELTVAVAEVYVCHCSICRRLTGAGGIAVVVVPNACFRWTCDAGAVRTWPKPGHDWAAHFCGVCGSPAPGPNDEARMFIPVGLLSQGADELAVAHHIFVDSKASWEVIGDAGALHAGAFGSGTAPP